MASISRQRGVAMAVSLIMLLVMTIVGVAAMNGARLEINMAGLIQDEQVALRRSEQALADAEQLVEDKVDAADPFLERTDDKGFYGVNDRLNDEVQSDAPDRVDNRDWSKVDSIAGARNTDDKTDNDDQIIIQYLGEHALPSTSIDESGDAPPPEETFHAYRITTRSATGAKSVRVIEAIYSVQLFDEPVVVE